MSTEPISKARLDGLIASKEFEIRCDHGGTDEEAGINDVRRDIIKALRDYARLREEYVEADLPRFTLRDYADAKRFTYLVEQGAPELCMAVLGVPVYTLDRARMLIDSASCLQGPRHE